MSHKLLITCLNCLLLGTCKDDINSNSPIEEMITKTCQASSRFFFKGSAELDEKLSSPSLQEAIQKTKKQIQQASSPEYFLCSSVLEARQVLKESGWQKFIVDFLSDYFTQEQKQEEEQEDDELVISEVFAFSGKPGGERYNKVGPWLSAEFLEHVANKMLKHPANLSNPHLNLVIWRVLTRTSYCDCVQGSAKFNWPIFFPALVDAAKHADAESAKWAIFALQNVSWSDKFRVQCLTEEIRDSYVKLGFLFEDLNEYTSVFGIASYLVMPSKLLSPKERKEALNLYSSVEVRELILHCAKKLLENEFISIQI